MLGLVVIQGGELITSLAEQNVERFRQSILIATGIVIVAVFVFSTVTYLQYKLSLYWRQWLSDNLLNQYFSERNFYQLNFNPNIDNPDRRIVEDVSNLTQESLKFLVIFVESILQIIIFALILWSISKPLMIFLILYSVVGTIVTFWFFGRILVGINLKQIQKEADFRYSLVRIQENAEAIALYAGQARELDLVSLRFIKAYKNFQHLIRWQLNLNFFQNGYQYLTLIIPGLFLAPDILSGKMEVGAITQAGSSFRSVLAALALIITQFEQLSSLTAAVKRVASLQEFLSLQKLFLPKEARIIDTQEDSLLNIKHLTLQTPDYQTTLVKDLSVTIAPREGLLIKGSSGVGKSSLLRATAGLWQSGTGLITKPPSAQIFFLPQNPYMILGSLRQQLLYPQQLTTITDETLLQTLKQVNLSHLSERFDLDTEKDWSTLLSLGEQQRLAFARLLLYQPQYAILDEATSALDNDNEELLYKLLRQTGITFVSVGHRPSLVKYHQQVLELRTDLSWHLST